MNIEKIRDDTPGTTHVIHLNNAGASLMPKPVYQAFNDYLIEELNQGGYETADKYQAELEDFYVVMAQLLKAQPNEIAYLENATQAWDMAFYSIPFKEGDRILTSRVEYASNFIAYLQIKKRRNIEIDVIDSLPTGEIDLEATEKALAGGGVKLIALTHMPTNGGIVNPAEEIGMLAEKYGVLYLLDACQSVGQYPLDVRKLKCSFLSGTGRKYLRGPRGSGFLYVRQNVMSDIEPMTLDLHSAEWVSKGSFKVRPDARKFEKWETNLAGKIALSTAVQYILDIGIDTVWKRVQKLAGYLRAELSIINGIEVLDLGRTKSGIVTFRMEKYEADVLKAMLREKSINTSVAVKRHTLLDMQDRAIEAAIRASVHYYNTEEELDTFVHFLRTL